MKKILGLSLAALLLVQCEGDSDPQTAATQPPGNSQPITYQVIYEGNSNDSGNPPGADTVEPPSTVTVRTNSGNLGRTGHVFSGWNTRKDGTGFFVPAGTTISMPGVSLPMTGNSITLYAHWTVLTTRNWSGVAVSENGSVIAGVVNSGKIYVSRNGGLTFEEKGTVLDWRGIAMSGDGNTIAAYAYMEKLMVSKDGGDTWNQRDQVREWTGLAVSENGRDMAASARNDAVYFSADSGDRWDSNPLLNGNETAPRFSRLAGSGISAIVYNGSVLRIGTRTRAVSSIINTPAGSNGLCTSLGYANGRYFSFSVFRDNPDTTVDYYNDWESQWRTYVVRNRKLSSMTLNSNAGQIYALSAATQELYKSINFGESWAPVTVNVPYPSAASRNKAYFSQIAISRDGSVLVATGTYPDWHMFISTDGGATWQLRF